MNKCKDCKYWSCDKEAMSYQATALGLGKCARTIHLWNATEWAEDHDTLQFTDKARGCLAFTQDSSDYAADLYTMPNFGCVQFEIKGGDAN